MIQSIATRPHILCICLTSCVLTLGAIVAKVCGTNFTTTSSNCFTMARISEHTLPRAFRYITTFAFYTEYKCDWNIKLIIALFSFTRRIHLQRREEHVMQQLEHDNPLVTNHITRLPHCHSLPRMILRRRCHHPHLNRSPR